MPDPRPRADARRNRQNLLVAAESAFNAEGAGASLDDIARAAGVGNATLYRHFPTRRQLIDAVYEERIRALCELATEVRATEPPGAALLGWLRAVVEHISGSRGLRDAFADAHHLGGDGGTPQVAEWHRMTDDAAVPLLHDAQAAGTAHPDLHADELMALVAAVAHAGGGDPGDARRLLGFVCDGVARQK
ncbi:TetR/AcrR family transcriptional regulator [Amycolatopsis sp. CA-126428]|uniref:TetR/AcrR family transcriptional regulator n=1 Tax=Amycolatopsis sp. CA-126428 TaxID=2073158 RepID=UPI000CD08B80|nr:TetR/AcrR family transcriptional regulator [Amycolatopsis sp. CA-126428]